MSSLVLIVGEMLVFPLSVFFFSVDPHAAVSMNAYIFLLFKEKQTKQKLDQPAGVEIEQITAPCSFNQMSY